MTHDEDDDFSDLSYDEIEKANTIIKNVRGQIDNAIDSVKDDDYNRALEHLDRGIEFSNCDLCKKELGILKADITHANQICVLDSEDCNVEKKNILIKSKELKENFIPITTKKKIAKEKVKETQNIINPIKKDLKSILDELISKRMHSRKQ